VPAGAGAGGATRLYGDSERSGARRGFDTLIQRFLEGAKTQTCAIRTILKATG
jgi:hypothetical protein